jgi:hypothetical protein
MCCGFQLAHICTGESSFTRKLLEVLENRFSKEPSDTFLAVELRENATDALYDRYNWGEAGCWKATTPIHECLTKDRTLGDIRLGVLQNTGGLEDDNSDQRTETEADSNSEIIEWDSGVSEWNSEGEADSEEVIHKQEVLDTEAPHDTVLQPAIQLPEPPSNSLAILKRKREGEDDNEEVIGTQMIVDTEEPSDNALQPALQPLQLPTGPPAKMKTKREEDKDNEVVTDSQEVVDTEQQQQAHDSALQPASQQPHLSSNPSTTYKKRKRRGESHKELEYSCTQDCTKYGLLAATLRRYQHHT